MKPFSTLLLFFSFLLLGCDSKNNSQKTNKLTSEIKETKETAIVKYDQPYKITPISHATAIIEYNGKNIYIDPVGGIEAFKNFKNANAVFITHTHPDHLSAETLEAIKSDETIFVVPQTVADALPENIKKNIKVMQNGEKGNVLGIPIQAVAMYNIREEALKFHPKGAGNGYIFQLGQDRVYFSGDTEDTPEMRALKNIDKAFVCMNMPYTMTVEKAAEAVLAFGPKEVFPYHYRGKGGLSDVEKFKSLVEASSSIKVTQWNWYPDSIEK